MQVFRTVLIKPDEMGRLTSIEIPFNAAEIFNIQKGTIKVFGTINGHQYRNKLISRGRSHYIMTVDKLLQAQIGFCGEAMEIEVTMRLDNDALYNSGEYIDIKDEPCDMDVLRAIKTRRSIRNFSAREIEKSKIEKILEAGFCAPSAKGKRPWHFIVVEDKKFLLSLAGDINYKPFLTADCCIIVCGDKNIDGINDYLLEDCSAAIQNILLAVHGIGLGATWCGLLKSGSNCAAVNYKYICESYNLPEKIIPIAVIALGYPEENVYKVSQPRYEKTKVHWGKW